ncbi:gliding motility-associated C-terminal domain-containing protein, partial [uncultured Lutibacter sp.]|uniref:gliding motility-associated C-terminal domain-containing protein n=1 Tax=uncultured Lutibacter sp. TaxID=437739 RepID=UPI0026049479
TCNSPIITLDASSSTIQGTAIYKWSTGATTATIDVTVAGDYSVTVTDSVNGCSATSEVVTITEDNSEVEEVVNICDDLIGVSFGDILQLNLNDYLSVAGEGNGTWESIGNEDQLRGNTFDLVYDNSGDDYNFVYTGDNGCISQLTIQTCAVLPCSTSDLEISKVVTPNEDGFNDQFELLGLEGCGFSYDVQIFNRWGKMVYQSNNYQNNWRGYANTGGSTIGSSASLPTGTYYYIVNVLSSGFKPITGYIYLGTN